MRFLIAILLLSSSCFAQLDLTYSKQKFLSGVTSPQIVGEDITVGDDSGTPVIINGGVLKTRSMYTFVELEVLRNNEEVELSNPVETKREIDGKTETITKWTIKGEGVYRVTARAIDMQLGFKKVKIDFLIGSSPKPVPVDPIKPVDPPVVPDTLSPFAKEVRAAAISYVQGMGDDYARLAQGNYKTVLEASTEANKLDLVTRTKFKQDMGRIMQPILGNDQLPVIYPKIFQDMSAGFKGIK